MMSIQDEAFGRPGEEPKWTTGDKEAVGTAYSAASRVWFTMRHGHLTEVYYPTIDMPQIRDLRLLITDGKSFLHDEADRPACKTERMCPALGYKISRERPEAGYAIDKTVIADPHLPCVLQRIRVRGESAALARLKLYVACNPHLGAGGMGNNAEVFLSAGRKILVAERDGQWLAMGADCDFASTSVGYVGVSDTASALLDGFTPKWIYTRATAGNVSLTGAIDLREHPEFTLGLAFGESRHSALTTLFQSLAQPFDRQESRFVAQWQRAVSTRPALEPFSSDEGNLFRASYSLLLAHEDKIYAGAQIASLSIPWGDARTDADGEGGYHLVWTRDLGQTATGLLAAGQTQTPLRTLIYLSVAQLPDGGFPQNFWIDGRAFQNSSQLDEVAFPILLARRLHVEGACQGFDSSDLVRRATRLLILSGPITVQERWEELSGYSPSTLAVVIAACICAATFAEEAGEAVDAAFIAGYADWLYSRLREWTVTRSGTLLEGVPEHFVRLNPADPCHPRRPGEIDLVELDLASQPPGATDHFPAHDVVDAGFLELVRHGILRADDKLVIDSLRVVDHTLRRETPLGTAWRRYNHDGYGQGEGGVPYVGYGVGRTWPLLAGERGHYELGAGRSPADAIRAMERFAGPTGLLPEQVWDEPDVAGTNMRCGHATGAARPLLWAHAEYVKLLRSVRDGVPYDRFPEVAARYSQRGDAGERRPYEYWSFHHPTPQIPAGRTLRICAAIPFRLRVSIDDWKNASDVDSNVAYGIHFVDVPTAAEQREPLRFTMFWTDRREWEGRDFEVELIVVKTIEVERTVPARATSDAVATRKRSASRK